MGRSPRDWSEVPTLGLGTWQLRGDALRRALSAALEMGYRHVDTAQGYENEAEIGEVLRESGVPREDVFLVTKVWPDHLAERGLGVVEESLERLRVDRVDTLLVHWPSPTRPLGDYMPVLRAALEAAHARHVGVSNFPPSLLREALAMADLACHQIEYHPYLSQRRHLDLAADDGLFVTAYCPLAHGRAARDPLLGRIGERYGKTAAQVALRWLVQQPGVVAVPKASSEAHLRANRDVFDFELTAEEMRLVAGLDEQDRVIDPEFAPDWEA